MKRILFFAIISIVGMLAISGCDKQKTYDVVFDANGGTGEMQTQIFVEGKSQAIEGNSFVNKGRRFKGWNTLPDGSSISYTDGQVITLVSDITLYAQWTSKETEQTAPEVTEPTTPEVTEQAGPIDLNGHEYVDLGLPSGTKWATCNVGATNPEDYGYYLAWGETKPKNTYSWSNYRYANGGLFTLTKYCNNPANGYNGFTDNLTTLEACDDAATANWGDCWRMPTYSELQELVDVCTSEWTTLNGVRGRMFTGPNGNRIFLPATLWYNFGYEETNYGGEYDYGGCYWTSSLTLPESHCGLFLSIHSERCEDCFNNGVGRYMGLFVRPVIAR
jgi:hypothetical protein